MHFARTGPLAAGGAPSPAGPGELGSATDRGDRVGLELKKHRMVPLHLRDQPDRSTASRASVGTARLTAPLLHPAEGAGCAHGGSCHRPHSLFFQLQAKHGSPRPRPVAEPSSPGLAGGGVSPAATGAVRVKCNVLPLVVFSVLVEERGGAGAPACRDVSDTDRSQPACQGHRCCACFPSFCPGETRGRAPSLSHREPGRRRAGPGESWLPEGRKGLGRTRP